MSARTKSDLAAVICKLLDAENEACKRNVADMPVGDTGYTVQDWIQSCYESIKEMRDNE
jgi:hypothetical protein